MRMVQNSTKIIIMLLAVTLPLVVGCHSNREKSDLASQDTLSDSLSKAVVTKTFDDVFQNPYEDMGLTREEYKGKVLYDHYCAVCHGKQGDGNGFNAFNLESSFNVKPFNFTDSTAMATVSQDELKKAITEGGPAVGKSQYMPPWGYTLSKEEINQVIAYILTFSKKEE